MQLDDELTTRCKARVGSTLKGKWRLDRLLGMGGMAAVYAASHRNASLAAIKILHPQVAASAEARERFLREAYVSNKAGHTGTVTVLDDDVADDGAPYLVMELLTGETVGQRADRQGGRLPLGEVLWIAREALAVLAAAHDKGIVHRDIKPENLFLTEGGMLKVLDFGIARLRETNVTSKRTQTGMLLGTPGYMAPEQALGRWDEVDARTDLWAVGATIFNLLSGVDVHEGETDNERVIHAATRPARSLARILPSTPLDVVELVDRSLEFDQAKRFRDAPAMGAAIERFIASAEEKGINLGPIEPIPQAPDSSQDPTLIKASGHAEHPFDEETFGQASVSGHEIAALKDVFALLEKAIMARVQYGSAHKEAVRRLEAAHKQATSALALADGRLVFSVNPFAFVIGKEVLWEPKPPLDQIPYRLFSDGVRMFGLTRGLEEQELSDLIRILMRDPALIAPEDDLVTMLWDARFPHVFHEVVDSFAEGDQTERAGFEKDRQNIMVMADFDTSDQLEDCWQSRRKSAPGAESAVAAKQSALLGALAGDGASAGGAKSAREGRGRSASDLAMDEATIEALAKELEVDLGEVGERFVSAAVNAFMVMDRQGKADTVVGPLRAAVDGLAASSPADAVEFVCALCRAAETASGGRGGAGVGAKLAAALVSPGTLERVLKSAVDPRSSADQGPTFAKNLETMLRSLDGSHFDAVAAALAASPDAALRAALLSYVERTGAGHEAQIGALLTVAEVDLAVTLLRILVAMGTPAAHEAATKAGESPHAIVRIEALGHVEGLSSEKLRLELRRLLEDREEEVRVATLRTIGKYGVKAAGPSLVMRIRAATFDALSIEERRQALTTLHLLLPSRAEDMSVELLADNRLVSSDAHEQTRELAAEVLARDGTSDEARVALEAASKGRWKNSERVRIAATRALASVAQRTTHPPPVDARPTPDRPKSAYPPPPRKPST